MLKSLRSKMTVVLLILFSNLLGAQVLVNSNVIRGEKYVTPKLLESELNTIIYTKLKALGYEISEKVDSSSSQILFEAYLYQNPGQYPTVVIIARTERGVHFIVRDTIQMFISQSDGFKSLLKRILKKVPTSIDTNIIYDVTLGSIFYNSNYNIISLSTGAISKVMSDKNRITMENIESNADEYFLADLDFYLNEVLNLNGIKRKLGDKEIKVSLILNEKRVFDIKEIDSPLTLKSKHKGKITDLIKSLPTFLNKELGYETIITVSN